jgi:hypothetical protein
MSTPVAATETFPRILGKSLSGRTQKYSNHDQRDNAYLLNVYSAPELGHTLAILVKNGWMRK